MNYIFAALAILLASCTTFVKTVSPQEELRQGIRAGQVVQAGDEIRVTLVDQSVVVMTVTEVTESHIEGQPQSVLIDSVSALEIRRLSPERVVAVTAGSAIFSWWVIGLILSSIVVFPM